MKTISRLKHKDYEEIWSIEAGLSLLGSEVKQIRLTTPCIKNCYCVEINERIFLKNFNDRLIRLLLHKKQIYKILGMYSKTRRILIIDEIYDNKGKIKVNLVVAERLQKFDHRKAIIEKENRRNSKFLI